MRYQQSRSRLALCLIKNQNLEVTKLVIIKWRYWYWVNGTYHIARPSHKSLNIECSKDTVHSSVEKNLKIMTTASSQFCDAIPEATKMLHRLTNKFAPCFWQWHSASAQALQTRRFFALFIILAGWHKLAVL